MQGRWSELAVLTLLLALVTLPFLIAGYRLDVGLADVFGTPNGFSWERDEGMAVLRDVNTCVVVGTVLVCLGAIGLKIARPFTTMRLRPRAIVFLLSTLLVGPGLLANTLLKDNWGRPRPRQIVEFGGDAPFVMPWVMTEHCERNCSFVSGEGASAIWTVAPALLTPLPERPFVIAAAVGWGLVMGLVRIAMGGHFLSDVLIGAVLMLMVIWMFRRLLYRTIPERYDAAMERALGSAGLWLRGLASQR